MASRTEFLVSKSGQMSVPAGVRRRWGLTHGDRVTVIDLGDAVVLSHLDVGPNLKAAAERDRVPFKIL
jgi:AbrB family looped-hinge helix DNA binding protein